MKTLCLIALIAVTAGTAVRAQLNTNATPELLLLTHIYADGADFDGNVHTVIYRGNVCVSNADLKLTCLLLVADLPESGGHLNHVVAETNVVMNATDSKGQPVHVTSEKAVYNYSLQNGVTNETVTLTGSPRPQVVDARGLQSADVIVWDRANNSYHFSGNYYFGPNTNNVPAATNAPAANTNKLTATKIDLLPGTDTNYPPGSLDRAFPGGSGGRGF